MNRRILILSVLLTAIAALAPLVSAQIGGERMRAILYGPAGPAGVVEVVKSDRATVVTVKAHMPAVEHAKVLLGGTAYALDTSSQDGYAVLLLDSRLGHRIPKLEPGMPVMVAVGSEVRLKGVLQKAF